MSCSRSRRWSWRAAVFLFVLSAPLAAQDAVTGMCLDMRRTPAECDCASDQLRRAAGDEAYSLYDQVGARYRASLEQGVAMSDAWDSAVKAAAEARGTSFVVTLNETNKLGRAHRKAMKACK